MMMTRMPETVQRALGDDVAQAFATWLGDVLDDRMIDRREFGESKDHLEALSANVTQVRLEVDDLGKRLDKVEMRLDGVEKRLDIVELRLSSVEQGLTELRADVRELQRTIDERFDKLNERFDLMYDRMLSQTQWTIGLLSVFGTIIAILVGINQIGQVLR